MIVQSGWPKNMITTEMGLKQVYGSNVAYSNDLRFRNNKLLRRLQKFNHLNLRN